MPSQTPQGALTTIKANIRRRMRDGITVVPIDMVQEFSQAEIERVAKAPHLGTITYEEIENLPSPPFSLNPGFWPAQDVTFRLLDGKLANFVWLTLEPGSKGNKLRVRVFLSPNSEQGLMLMPTTLHADGTFGFDMQVIAANVSAYEGALNAARCALDGGGVMLASAITRRSWQ